MATSDPNDTVSGGGTSPASPAPTYPIGAIISYAGTEASLDDPPPGWLACDGTGYPIGNATYQALYAVIGTMYGGDGTKFYLPDYRGRFLRGVDAGRHLDPDAATRTPPAPTLGTQGNQQDNVGSYQADAFAAHTHDYKIENQSRNAQANQNGAMTISTASASSQANNATATGAGDTRPINISVFYLIRYTN